MWACLGAGRGDERDMPGETGADERGMRNGGQEPDGNGAGQYGTNTTVLCTVGIASTVSGTGPWDRSGTGYYGGTTAGCEAEPGAVNGVCGTADERR